MLVSEQTSDHSLVRRTCQFCGNAFWTKRRDAKYDSPACRQRALRWRRKMYRLRERIKREVGQLAEYMDYPDAKAASAEYMHATIRQIEAELVMHGIMEVK